MIHFTCRRCCDVGVVECHQGSLKVLAKCFCSAGKKQPWDLEMIPIQGFKDMPVEWREYKSKNESHKQEIMAWHIERIRQSEEFWKSQEEPPSEVKA